MIGFGFRHTDETKNVKAAAERAAYRNLGHAGASIRKDARESIVRSPDPAPAGQPIHTRKGRLPRAIFYAATQEYAVIGTAHSRIGPAGEPHEHGGAFRGQKYESRPFMTPAMLKNLNRFARSWGASVRP